MIIGLNGLCSETPAAGLATDTPRPPPTGRTRAARGAAPGTGGEQQRDAEGVRAQVLVRDLEQHQRADGGRDASPIQVRVRRAYTART